MNKAAYILYRRSGGFYLTSDCLKHLPSVPISPETGRQTKTVGHRQTDRQKLKSDIDDDGMDGHAVLKQHYHINAPLHTNKWSRNGVALFTR